MVKNIESQNKNRIIVGAKPDIQLENDSAAANENPFYIGKPITQSEFYANISPKQDDNTIWSKPFYMQVPVTVTPSTPANAAASDTTSLDMPNYNIKGNKTTIIVRAISGSMTGFKVSEDGGETWFNGKSQNKNGAYTDEVTINKYRYGEPTMLADRSIIMSPVEDGGKSIVSKDGGKTWDFIDTLGSKCKIYQWHEPASYNRGVAREGRNLLSVLGCSKLTELGLLLRRRSWYFDFDDIRLGDYFDLDELTYQDFNAASAVGTPITIKGNSDKQNLRFEVAGINTFDMVGSENSGPGLFFIAKNPFFLHKQYTSNSNNHDLNAVEYQRIFDHQTTINSLENQLGLTGIKCRRPNDNRVGLKYVWRFFQGAWNATRVFFLTEVEIFGKPTFASQEISNFTTSLHLPLFSEYPNARIKKYDGANVGWWVSSRSTVSPRSCCVTKDGTAGTELATNPLGVVPCIYI